MNALSRAAILGTAFAVLGACSHPGPSLTDTNPGSDGSSQETTPGMDAPVDQTVGMDVTPVDTAPFDTRGTDVMPVDAVPTDAPPVDAPTGPDPCLPGAVVNLSTAGTLSGQTTTYMGSNTAALALPMATACSPSAGHVVAFSYTVRTRSQLLVSTFHTATTPNFDTVAWAMPTCTITGTPLGCSDDVSGTDSVRNPAVPNTALRESIFTTVNTGTDPTFAAGTIVYLFVAGYVGANAPYLETGSFQLTVTEIPPPGALGSACEPGAMTSLCPASLACAATGTDYSTFTCVAAGVAGAPCRGAAPFCDGTLVCNPNSYCVPSRAIGQPCDPTGAADACVADSSCVTRGTTSTCVADGSSGAACRFVGAPCDTGLGCNLNNMCVPTVANGAVCDGTGVANVCALGASCIGADPNAHCLADGSMGANCRFTDPPCDTGLGCDSNGTCVTGVMPGGSCDPNGVSSVCVSTASCIGTSTGTCINNGAVNGACRRTSPACDAGLGCDGNSICVTGIASGSACDPSGAPCVSGSTCIAGSGPTRCIPDGSLAGRCRDTAPFCDAMATCNADPTATDSRCIASVNTNGACDPTGATNRCADGSVCTTSGTMSTCTTHGFTAGASTATWIDACAMATSASMLLAGSDDGTAAIALPFPITFYGTTYAAGAMSTVSADGWYSFNANEPGRFAQGPLPVAVPANSIMPLWMDLTFRSGTPAPSVCFATSGTTPARTFVVEWNNASFLSSSTDSVTMEIQFHEGSSAFDVLYNQLVGTTAFNAATVGVESPLGTSYLQRCAGRAAPTACAAMHFTSTRYTPTP